MTKTTAHSNCLHDNTKAARAKCRKANKAFETARAESITALAAAYYDSTNDMTDEEIIFALGAIDSDLIEGYYDNTLTVEEIIARLRAV